MATGTERSSAGRMSVEMLAWALRGLEHELAVTRARLGVLAEQERTLRARVNGHAQPPPAFRPSATIDLKVTPAVVAPPAKKFSAAARRRIAAAQRARWARHRAEQQKKKSA